MDILLYTELISIYIWSCWESFTYPEPECTFIENKRNDTRTWLHKPQNDVVTSNIIETQRTSGVELELFICYTCLSDFVHDKEIQRLRGTHFPLFTQSIWTVPESIWKLFCHSLKELVSSALQLYNISSWQFHPSNNKICTL